MDSLRYLQDEMIEKLDGGGFSKVEDSKKWLEEMANFCHETIGCEKWKSNYDEVDVLDPLDVEEDDSDDDEDEEEEQNKAKNLKKEPSPPKPRTLKELCPGHSYQVN